jgi:predicted polyphosphate/ATP-dependent NAD kinase
MRIGFLVNPIAGLGGAVGLKGTDGMVVEARARGARPHANERAVSALLLLSSDADILFSTCSGAMGEDALRTAGIQGGSVVYRYEGESSAEDTKRAAARFRDLGVDLILFCGGDGTARDIVEIVQDRIPILGIPAGVKMYSAVFAVDPKAAAELVRSTGRLPLRESEVVDVDEVAYRSGTLSTRIYGIARVPYQKEETQSGKQVYEEEDEGRAKEEIARFISEVMLEGTLYILGAGTTTGTIAKQLGVGKTLLGVDAVKNGKLVAADADEKTLLSLIDHEKDVQIIVSPIGAQGFVLGRGNQQISAGVVRRVGVKKVIVVATPHKLTQTTVLYVDTGDPALDREFGEYVSVISGYRIAQRKRLYR